MLIFVKKIEQFSAILAEPQRKKIRPASRATGGLDSYTPTMILFLWFHDNWQEKKISRPHFGEEMHIEKVAVIGTGMMGPGIAAVIALAGFDVTLVGERPDWAEDGVKKAHGVMDQLLDNDLTTASIVERAKPAVRGTTELPTAVQGAQLVIEAISEDLELKQHMFQTLDRLTPPEVLLATNTSGLSVTRISALATHRERVATTHFWMPAHLVPLVEVVMSPDTSEQTARP